MHLDTILFIYWIESKINGQSQIKMISPQWRSIYRKWERLNPISPQTPLLISVSKLRELLWDYYLVHYDGVGWSIWSLETQRQASPFAITFRNSFCNTRPWRCNYQHNCSWEFTCGFLRSRWGNLGVTLIRLNSADHFLLSSGISLILMR